MPDSFSICINPDCLNFLNQYKKNLSTQQKIFKDSIEGLNNIVNTLRSQVSFEFTHQHKKEVERGNFYAITPSLERKQSITLTDLQSALEQEFHADEKQAAFIITSLLEPTSLPFEFSKLAYSLLINSDYIWSNNSSSKLNSVEYSLKATCDPSNENIFFSLALDLKDTNYLTDNEQQASLGNAHIQFMMNPQRNIQLLPLDMIFELNEECSKSFIVNLLQDFKDWVLQQHELDKAMPKPNGWQTTDRWFLPILSGWLLGLTAMISLLALSLAPISPLIFPPLGLAIGLSLASFINTYAHIKVKKDTGKLKRPIYLLNKELPANTPKYTTSFFNSSPLLSPSTSVSRKPKP